MRRLHGWLTVFWIAMIPFSASSVAYVSALSLWALVLGHWAAWQAARVEVTQDKDIRKKETRKRRRRALVSSQRKAA
jgi:hypothetical protein